LHPRAHEQHRERHDETRRNTQDGAQLQMKSRRENRTDATISEQTT
jgi:hypothetical protein